MNCIVVDDDQLSRLAISKCVERTDFLNLVEVCSDAFEAMKVVREHDIDLIFLDIEMPEMTGMEFIQALKDIPQIILITAKKDYAAEAFNYDVTDYIVKPVNYPRFLKAVEKARLIADNVQSESPEADHIFIKKDAQLMRLELNEILFVEAFADYVNIHTETARYTVLSTMKAIQNKLPESDFIRVHRSYIVRVDKILSLEDSVISVGKQTMPVSRSYKPDLMDRLNLL